MVLKKKTKGHPPSPLPRPRIFGANQRSPAASLSPRRLDYLVSVWVGWGGVGWGGAGRGGAGRGGAGRGGAGRGGVGWGGVGWVAGWLAGWPTCALCYDKSVQVLPLRFRGNTKRTLGKRRLAGGESPAKLGKTSIHSCPSKGV